MVVPLFVPGWRKGFSVRREDGSEVGRIGLLEFGEPLLVYAGGRLIGSARSLQQAVRLLENHQVAL